jgi:hypothetical protein
MHVLCFCSVHIYSSHSALLTRLCVLSYCMFSSIGGGPKPKFKESALNCTQREMTEECGFDSNLFTIDDYAFTKRCHIGKDIKKFHYFLSITHDRAFYDNMVAMESQEWARAKREIYGKISVEVSYTADRWYQRSTFPGLLQLDSALCNHDSEMKYLTQLLLLCHAGVSEQDIDTMYKLSTDGEAMSRDMSRRYHEYRQLIGRHRFALGNEDGNQRNEDIQQRNTTSELRSQLESQCKGIQRLLSNQTIDVLQQTEVLLQQTKEVLQSTENASITA